MNENDKCVKICRSDGKLLKLNYMDILNGILYRKNGLLG